MRRLFTLVLVQVFSLSNCFGAWALVQSTGNALTASGVQVSSTFTVTPTIGNLIVMWVTASNNVALAAVGWNPLTSSAGGSGATQRSGRMFWRIHMATHPAWGQHNAGGNAGRTISMAEFSGVDTTNAFMVENSQLTASANLHWSPTVSPSEGVNALAVTGYLVRSDNGFSGQELTGDLASTELEDRWGNTLNTGSLAYNDITSTTGVYASTGTSTNADVGVAAIAFFRALVGGGPPADDPALTPDNRPPDPSIIGF